MVYKISYEDKTSSELEKLPLSISKRIIDKIEKMAENPSSYDVKKLKSSDYYRLRLGDYRIIFIFDNSIIKVLKVGHRKNIYD